MYLFVKGIFLLSFAFIAVTHGAILASKPKEPPVSLQPDDNVPPPPMVRHHKFLREPPRWKAEKRQPDIHRPPLREPPRVHPRPFNNHPSVIRPQHAFSPKPARRPPVLVKQPPAALSPKPARRPPALVKPPASRTDSLLRRQEWAEANDLFRVRSDVVHDRTVGERGIMALIDEELRACFINHNLDSFVLPSSQRLFYANKLPATVIETDDEQEQFLHCVGPVVGNHCQNVKSYWLDMNLFYAFVHGCLSSPHDFKPGEVHDYPVPRKESIPERKLNPGTDKSEDVPEYPVPERDTPPQLNIPEPELKMPPLSKIMASPERKYPAPDVKIQVPERGNPLESGDQPKTSYLPKE